MIPDKSEPDQNQPGSDSVGEVLAPTSGQDALGRLLATLEPKWAEVVTGWLAQYQSATATAYSSDLAAWLRYCVSNGLGPGSVGPGDVGGFRGELEELGARPATDARELGTLSSFYAFAVLEGLLPHSPIERVRRPKVTSDTATLGIDHDQARWLLKAAQLSGPRDHALICLLLLNGLRVSEACGSRIEDIGAARGHVTLDITRKGGRAAVIPLATRTAEALALTIGGRSAGPIFLDYEGRPLDRFDAARVCRRLGRTADIGAVNPHALRHGFVTLCLDAGTSLRDVQDAAGHVDPRTTRRYDRGRYNLDRHPTYALAGSLTGEEETTGDGEGVER